MSKGCHQLIKQGAKLVDCLQDIVEELNLSHSPQSHLLYGATINAVNPIENTSGNIILTTMGYDPITLDNLVTLSGLTVSDVSSMLMLLELEGKIASLTGGKFQKIM
jgi:DNA processing protein